MQGDKNRGVLLSGCPPSPGESSLPEVSSGCMSCSSFQHGAGVHRSHMGKGMGLFSVTLHHQLPPREVAMEQALWSPPVTQDHAPRVGRGSMGCPSPEDHPWLGEAARPPRQTQSLGELFCYPYLQLILLLRTFFNAFSHKKIQAPQII